MLDETRFQNSRRRSTRRLGGLPAISAALIAPIDTPAIQSGASPTSARPAYTPAWYAPSAPPPCNTRTVWSNLPRFTTTFEGGVFVLVFIALYPRSVDRNRSLQSALSQSGPPAWNSPAINMGRGLRCFISNASQIAADDFNSGSLPGPSPGRRNRTIRCRSG